jgi:hypothetical protein
MSGADGTPGQGAAGDADDVLRLVYPAPPTPLNLSRPLAVALRIALVVAYVAFALLVGWFLGWDVLPVFVVVVIIPVATRRLWTVVTAETVSVHHWVVKRDLPVASLTSILRDGPFRLQVSVRTVDGRRHFLPQAKPRDMAAISALTGLPLEEK